MKRPWLRFFSRLTPPCVAWLLLILASVTRIAFVRESLFLSCNTPEAPLLKETTSECAMKQEHLWLLAVMMQQVSLYNRGLSCHRRNRIFVVISIGGIRSS